MKQNIMNNIIKLITFSKSTRFISPLPVFLLVLILFPSFSGCTAKYHREKADKTALKIIKNAQESVLGKSDDFSIERPSDILRRRLLTEQELATYGKASLGTDALEKIKHWPEKKYPAGITSSDVKIDIPEDKPLLINFLQALEIAAENSSDYQSQKETLFRAALTLDLNRNDYSFIAKAKGDSTYSLDNSPKAIGDDPVKGLDSNGSLGISKTFKYGAKLAANLSVDLVKLLTAPKNSAFGIIGDASISIPLLRGSKSYIYAENLTQAERNVVYAVYDFERYKKTFTVNIASNYFSVLRQLDQIENSEQNYKNTISSARRTRRLADAGKITQIEVDQAVQRELTARNNWISSRVQYKNRLDSFKQLLGLPPDSSVELDRSDLDSLRTYITKIVPETDIENISEASGKIPPQDAPIELKEPDGSNKGPMELDESEAILLGLKNRLDLKVSEGKIYDAQRSVIIRADALGAELNLVGQGRAGESRSLASAAAGMEDGKLRPDLGVYSAVLNLDLPIERSAERKAYRESYISLESAVRSFQKLEDDIKLSIRQSLRAMSEAREALKIQKLAVSVAEKRVDSTDKFFQAGRAQLRDLLEANESLLTAKNSFTAAVIDYRVAELEFQRNAGVLEIDKDGLMVEYTPGGNK